MASETLQEAYRLIREGNKPEATRLLVPYVRAEPLDADGWWLLANALEDPIKQRRALERVISLRPDDERARRMLDRMQLEAPPPSPLREPPPQPVPVDVNTTEVFDEPFEDDPFAEGAVRVHRGRSGGCLTIALAIIGLITIVSCGLCIVTLTLSAPTVSRVFQDIILTVTAMPVLSVPVNVGTPAAPATLPRDLTIRGTLALGDTVEGTVDTFQDDGWTFSGDAEQKVIIELNATDATLDPHLYLYAPNQQQLAENDDIDGQENRNSRIEITLPSAGKYTIRVSKFSGGGDYELSLTQG